MADDNTGTAGTYDRLKEKYKYNPVPSYNFALEVEAAFFMPLKSVRVFNKENEFEYYQEGGLNDYVHMLRKPISKPFTFQVERYVGTSASTDFNTSFVDPIALGTDLVLPLVLYVTQFPASNSGDNFSFTSTPRAYVFTGCTVTAKEYGELNAEKSGLLTETTTIAYKELFVFNSLNPSWEGKELYEFPKDPHAKGNKPKNNIKWSDKDTIKDPSLWVYDGTVKGGGKSHDQNKKAGGEKHEGTPWDIDSAQSPYTPSDHVKWSDKDTVNDPVLWEYDGTVQGKGTRRALMANELAK